MIDTIIATINDKQKFNNKEVMNLFVDLFSEIPPEEIDMGIIKDYLKIQDLNDKSQYHDIAGSILNEISSSNLEFYQNYIEELRSEDIEFVPFYHEKYPDRLWGIPDAPLCLFVDGDLSALSNGVAVVGTRDAYEHRTEFVRRIAHKLVEMNKVVVSGLANGVDEAAHKGALEAGGKTVAILPGHVKKIRPSSNKELGEKIRESGALVGEISSKKSIHRGRFVERNRITSGISSAVIIGASGKTGGTIHQAKFAKEQDKPRFLYSPEKEDGQSPKEVIEKGFVQFETLSEMEKLLNSKFVPPQNESNKPATLDDFN